MTDINGSVSVPNKYINRHQFIAQDSFSAKAFDSDCLAAIAKRQNNTSAIPPPLTIFLISYYEKYNMCYYIVYNHL